MTLTKRKEGAFLECSEILTKPSITSFPKIDLYWWEVGVRDGAALEGGPECDECLLSRIKQPWGSPLLLCHCFLFLI